MLKKDTGATVMSKFKSSMSPLDHLQPEATKSESSVFKGRRSWLKVWGKQPEHGPPLLFSQGRLGSYRDSRSNSPPALEHKAVVVVAPETVARSKGFA